MSIRSRLRKSGRSIQALTTTLPEPPGVIELARWFSKQPKHKRGILFLTFAGEELGLLGSEWYVNHPILPLENAVAMINMDMIGRIRDGKIYLSGTGTGSTFEKLLEEVKAPGSLHVDLSEKTGYGSSDHTSFTTKQVPGFVFLLRPARRLSQAERYRR